MLERMLMLLGIILPICTIGYLLVSNQKKKKFEDKVQIVIDILYESKDLKIEEIVQKADGKINAEEAFSIVEELEQVGWVGRTYPDASALRALKEGVSSRPLYSLDSLRRQFMDEWQKAHGENE